MLRKGVTVGAAGAAVAVLRQGTAALQLSNIVALVSAAELQLL
jgi:hypothetical protein